MKRLVLFLIVIAVIGGGIFVLTAQEEDSIELRDTKLEPSGEEESSFFEPSEILIIKNIIKNALDVKFNAETATYKVADLDGKGGPELIIGATEDIPDLTERPSAATILVVSILNREGEYERMGKVEYQEWIREVPEVRQLADIDGDGQEEIIMSLMYGGASSWTEGILRVDFAEKRMGWILMQKVEEGGDPGLRSAIFTIAASAGHQNTFQIEDMDNDGNKEIVEIFMQTVLDKTECEVDVYEWNGFLFAFDQTLSEQLRQRLEPDCTL